VLQAGIELIDARSRQRRRVLAVAAAALTATRLPSAVSTSGHRRPGAHVLGAVHGDHGAAGGGAASDAAPGPARRRAGRARNRRGRARRGAVLRELQKFLFWR